MLESQKASVVIPTKNRCHLVVEAVESALCAANVAEVIVVDDGSTDDTAEYLRRFGERIIVLTGPFGGAAAARNAGAARAQHALLSFLDDDDQMLPDKVPTLIPCFLDEPLVALACGRVQVIDEAGGLDSVATTAMERLFQRAEMLGTSYPTLARYCMILTPATLIRKAAFENVGGYDETLPPPYEDLDLYLRLSLGWRLVYARSPVARVRRWPGNFDSQTHAEGMLALASKHIELLHTSFPSLIPKTAQRQAMQGLYRRMAVSSQFLLRTGEARRLLLRAACSAPGTIDLGMLRLLFASLVPKTVLRRRREYLRA